MSRLVRRVLTITGVAGLALATLGLTGGGARAATAAPQSVGPPSYNWGANVGYMVTGQLFRYVCTTVTVPPSAPYRASMEVWLQGYGSFSPTVLSVPAGGGKASWQDPSGWGKFRISPHTGDRVYVSIYYDQHGHNYLTVKDVTQKTAQTIRTNVPAMRYITARVKTSVNPAFPGPGWSGPVLTPPATDTRLWTFTGTGLTTYSGKHGTISSPWTATAEIATTTMTAAGTVTASPSAPTSQGRNFTAWLRALPRTYTDGLAGYVNTGRTFRYVGSYLTVPSNPNAGTALVSLSFSGGPTPRPYAQILVGAGGGPGSVRYQTSTSSGTFPVNPQPGDQVFASVYYDQRGHDQLTVRVINHSTTVVITRPSSPIIGSTPYNTASLTALVDNASVTPPPADTRTWVFAGTRVTTYNGDRGVVMGPWVTRRFLDTTTGTAAGSLVVSPSVLSYGNQTFSLWLRHR